MASPSGDQVGSVAPQGRDSPIAALGPGLQGIPSAHSQANVNREAIAVMRIGLGTRRL